jgi:hypothetical protein
MLGGCNLTSPNWNSSQYDVDKAILAAFTKIGVKPFFSVDVFPDFANSSKKSFAVCVEEMVFLLTVRGKYLCNVIPWVH